MHNYKFLKMIGAMEEGVEEVGWERKGGGVELGKKLCGGVV